MVVRPKDAVLLTDHFSGDGALGCVKSVFRGLQTRGINTIPDFPVQIPKRASQALEPLLARCPRHSTPKPLRCLPSPEGGQLPLLNLPWSVYSCCGYAPDLDTPSPQLHLALPSSVTHLCPRLWRVVSSKRGSSFFLWSSLDTATDSSRTLALCCPRPPRSMDTMCVCGEAAARRLDD